MFGADEQVAPRGITNELSGVFTLLPLTIAGLFIW